MRINYGIQTAPDCRVVESREEYGTLLEGGVASVRGRTKVEETDGGVMIRACTRDHGEGPRIATRTGLGNRSMN